MKSGALNLLKKLLIVALVAVFATSLLVACKEVEDDDGNGTNTQTNGNNNGEGGGNGKITESGYAEAAYTLIEAAVSDHIDPELAKTVLADLKATCEKADRILKSSLSDNEDYVMLRDEFVTKKASYTVAVENFYSSALTDADRDLLYSLLTKYYDALGKDGFADFVYDMVLYRLEVEYEEASKSDADLGTPRDSTAELKQDFEAFKEEVPRKDFSHFLNNSILILNLVMDKQETNTTQEGTFELTDAEIVDMVKKPDFTCDISVAGWTVILKKMQIFFSEETYIGKMLRAANKSKDFGKFAEKMDNVVSFCISAQSYADATSVNLLRTDIDSYFLNLKDKLSKDEWANLEDLVDIDVSVVGGGMTEYDKAAVAYYEPIDNAAGYIAYAGEHPSKTVDDWKNAKTAEDIRQATEGIVANISPAFAYDMFAVK